jgi:hypothetical protein
MKRITLRQFAAGIAHVTRALRLRGPDAEWAGIFVHSKLERWGYEATPLNSVTFGSTGGDGVHFGFLHVDGEKRDDGPIVMTVPMAFERPNIVVAETLSEFVRIGCRSGWFVLEQLAYSPAWTVKHYSAAESSDSPEGVALKALRKRLRIRWAPLSRERLSELKRKYARKIVVAERPA